MAVVFNLRSGFEMPGGYLEEGCIQEVSRLGFEFAEGFDRRGRLRCILGNDTDGHVHTRTAEFWQSLKVLST